MVFIISLDDNLTINLHDFHFRERLAVAVFDFVAFLGLVLDAPDFLGLILLEDLSFHTGARNHRPADLNVFLIAHKKDFGEIHRGPHFAFDFFYFDFVPAATLYCLPPVFRIASIPVFRTDTFE